MNEHRSSSQYFARCSLVCLSVWGEVSRLDSVITTEDTVMKLHKGVVKIKMKATMDDRQGCQIQGKYIVPCV